MTDNRRVTTIDLNGEWTLRLAGGNSAPTLPDAIPAEVPGCVHTDLLAADLIPDPYSDDNEARLAWIGASDWEYTRDFTCESPTSGRALLRFDGLDTVARISVNGHDLAHTCNMHRSYEFDVTALLRDGANTVTVLFDSPVKAADRASLELGYRPHVNHHPYNALRKMACNFGWDWGPDVVTSGIWKGVSLTQCEARIASLRVDASVSGEVGQVNVTAAVDGGDATELFIECELDGRRARWPVGSGAAAQGTIAVSDPDLWWPVGYGAPATYDVEVRLVAGDTVIDRANRRIGFRTVSVDTTPDDDGTPFRVVVNGVPVFIRGANWIPDDAFPHRVDRERYAARLDQALFANINLLRVWGGGIYEKDEFYDECDARGILTWQDFLFACAAYAEEEPLAQEIEAEARENVSRLAHHASLIILNGNNENLWGHEDWRWQARLQGKSWGEQYYYEMLPAITAELAPQIVYTPGSPFSPDRRHHPNDSDHGTMHIWDLWNERDYPAYREYSPRFVAEFGWQGPPTWTTLVEAIHDDPMTPESPGLIAHQKAVHGNAKLTDGLVGHFELPNNMDDWHWAMSLNQAIAVRTAVEHFRSLSPRCAGSIVWQLNDCWPVISWAAVDGAGRAKPLLHALRQAYADTLITIQPRDGGLIASVVNDSASDLIAAYTLKRIDYDGTVLAEVQGLVSVDARSTDVITIPDELSIAERPERECVIATVGDWRAVWFFAEHKDSELAAPVLDCTLSRDGDQYTATITAGNLVRDLAVLIDRLDPAATTDTMLDTLLPGETIDVRFTSAKDLTVRDFEDPLVVRSSNQLVTR